MSDAPFWPRLPYADWQETRTTLHLFCQMVGKVRLAKAPKQNHWWHVPLYVAPRGLTTSAIPGGGGLFELELDLLDHAWRCRTSGGEERDFALPGLTVAGFLSRQTQVLAEMGIDGHILARPFDPAKAGSDVPFAEDDRERAYDRDAVQRFHRALVAMLPVMQTFRGRFVGKSSPVHLFWHSLDLAVTRFSGRRAEVAADADLVTREAYSHEVISSGFWAGDDNVPYPAFYTYVAPEPAGLAEEPLRPAAAWWDELDGGSHMALLRYDDAVDSGDPAGALRDFLESTFDAGARRGGWDVTG